MFKKTVLFFLLFCAYANVHAQQNRQKFFLQSLDSIFNDSITPSGKKLEKLYSLKQTADRDKVPNDSNYAKLLFRIASYEEDLNKNFNIALKLANKALQINLTNKTAGSKYDAARCCYWLAWSYRDLNIFSKALNYLDSTITIARTFPDTTSLILNARITKVYLCFLLGDYQKAVEESIQGASYALKKNNPSYALAFENQKAQSLYFENNNTDALTTVNAVIINATHQQDYFELASALKTKAGILQRNRHFIEADSLFRTAIIMRGRVKEINTAQIATDYNDYGNFCLDSLHNYALAKNYYLKSIEYGKMADDSTVLARANNNIAAMYLSQKDYNNAGKYCLTSMKYLDLDARNIINNPSSDALNAIGVKGLIIAIMNNKIEVLKGLYLKTKSKQYLTACLHTALVMDTLITKMRHTQVGNESKLYWRNHTRNFYANAIDAAYLNNDAGKAFYFMEKSRAVLLNDKLNELDASSFLSDEDVAKQEGYEIRRIELQQKLALLRNTSGQYNDVQLQLLNASEEENKFIQYLEQRYPVYSQYKYADEVIELNEFQLHLKKSNQSFIHYFTGDTATYILAITANGTKFIRLSSKAFPKEQLSAFLRMCSSKQQLNHHYASFAALSNSIYKKIFQRLDLPPGRVVICQDDIVIPFEALCTDAEGKNFLLSNYTFDYVYSVRFLTKQFSHPPARAGFAGFAPVKFASYLQVSTLVNSEDALNASSAWYKNSRLFKGKTASRGNFFDNAFSYSTVSIFSHARADSATSEPYLFMQDSVIYLSELQRLNNPATKLVLLNACETSAGKSAAGEGIYSLARGFAAAGIPSVAATLWKADEKAIYIISEKFNQYLSEGMPKDEALQKAKLYFIQHNAGNEERLPYYWANLILIGNADILDLTATENEPGNYLFWLIMAGSVAMVILISFLLRKAINKKRAG